MFGKSLTLFQVFGIKVKVNIGWAVIALLIAWSLAQGFFPALYEGLPPQTYWWMGLAGVIGLFFSILLHELSHSVVARAYGMTISGITLFLFGGAAEMEDEPPSPEAEIVMAIAGPVMSGLLAGLFYLGAWAVQQTGGPQPALGVLRYLGVLNLVLIVFNLVPAFPLDGGRVLRGILWARRGDLRWATWRASRIGAAFGLVLMGFGALAAIAGAAVGGLWWILIGLFIRFAAQSSYYQLEARRYLEGEPVSRFMTEDPATAPPDITVRRLADEWIYKFHHEFFPVTDGGRVVGCVGTGKLKEIPSSEWDKTTVREIMSPCSDENSVDADEDAVKALAKMQKSGQSRLMVLRKGKLVGVITLKDLLKLISLRMDLEHP